MATSVYAKIHIYPITHGVMTKQAISQQDLIDLANQLLREHEDYIPGIEVREVSQQRDVLTFKGEAFLDDDLLPTSNSPKAFNLYKWLCHRLSEQYTLSE
ncbi:hypothetical protein OAG1_38590 [Agarivorans sp. OAG1]|uniref:DUF2498 family protein n=1 Tax=Agarivorans TaxID=261825 RepID=UPI002044D8FC|nr:DUF2498 family protein [Agarivorans albus]BEU05059.1 hypothetical protein OAG1_38590 [Agarivorans sp. OAG1]